MDATIDMINMKDALECHFPVTVVLKKTWRNHRSWRYPYWIASGVIPEQDVAKTNDKNTDSIITDSSSSVTSPGESKLNATRQFTSEGGDEHYIWPGLQFSLYRDGLTSYFQNLNSSQPCLFILCRDDEDQTPLEPVLISADFADAEAHMETEGTVLTLPLSSPFDKWIADYVLQNKLYLEKQAHEGKKHKRKRATTQL